MKWLLLLCPMMALAATPQLPPPQVQDFPNRLHIVQRATLVETNRVRCTTNCPLARSNTVFSWRPEYALAWDASVSGSITNYRIYYGATAPTNSFNAGLNRTNWLTNCPPGVWNVAVTAVNSQGLESDPGMTLRLTNDSWLVENWTALRSDAVTSVVSTNLFTVSPIVGMKFIRVRANRTGSKYVGVAWR